MGQVWRRNLRTVWVAEFLAVIAFSSFVPMLPYYIQSLSVSEESVEAWSGIVISAPFWAMAVVSPIWGMLSDRYGRKVMVERAMFSGFVITLLMGFSQNVGQLALFRLIQGALTGTVTAATTLVASGTPRDRLGETLGKLQLAIFMGQSLGPICGGFVADQLGYAPVFWMAAGFLLIAGLLIFLFVRESFTPVEQDDAEPLWHSLRQNFGLIFTESMLGLVLALRFSLRVGRQLPQPVLSLLVQDLLPEGSFVGSAAGLLTTVSGLSGAVAAPTLGRLADKYGGRTILLGCAWVGGTALIVQSLAPGYILLLICQALLGLTIGGTLATLSAYVGRLAPEGRSGAAYGLDAMAVSMSGAVGPFVGGWIARWFTLRTPFMIGGILMSLSSLGVLRLPKDKKVSEQA